MVSKLDREERTRRHHKALRRQFDGQSDDSSDLLGVEQAGLEG